jgi:FixJ family two-component response regulator
MATLAPMVFVVDDDASVRKGLTRVLTGSGYAVEEFASAGDFLARERYARGCCLVLDVQMPGLSGLELQTALATAGRRLSIVFVTGHVDVPMTVQAMRNGAVDVLTKPVGVRELLNAIQQALAKDTENRREEARVADVEERARRLSRREMQVFALVVTGMLNKQIAGVLGVVEKTVKVHRARVMTKMEAGSVAELVRLSDRLSVNRSDRTRDPRSQRSGSLAAGWHLLSQARKHHGQASGALHPDRHSPVDAVVGPQRLGWPAHRSAAGGAESHGRDLLLGQRSV